VSRPSADPAFSTREFRDTLGCFATGVTVITTSGSEHPYGMTANAFSSVSIEPPLVLVCVMDGTEGSASIRRNGVFAVNVLGAEQEGLSRYFASRDRPRGWETFEGISYRRVETDSPVIDGSAAYFDCRLVDAHPAGDHIVFIGEVLALGVYPEIQPLLFHHGRYRRVDAEEGRPAPHAGDEGDALL
jgi:flavin reductase (DIM6/NTAB) family NADH-FMN oxidoreductase RutF